MVYRFGNFELDEERRELRLGNRELVVQPLVFEILAYLVRHRDRVVPKDELLEELWEDALVVDGALQRVVSLARTALDEDGLSKAIRTYPRRGYRFCGDVVDADSGTVASSTLASARAARKDADWEAAVEGYRAADKEAELDGPDLEDWAYAINCAGRIAEAVAPLERAVATYSLQRDRRGAARAALGMAMIQFERKEMSVAKGWRDRATRILRDVEECPEHATLELLASRIAMAEGRLRQSLVHAQKTCELGRRLKSADHEALGLVSVGNARIALGDIDRGVAEQDEAAAWVLSGEVNPWAGGLVYCAVVWACRNLGDWKRAGEWTEQFTRWCQESLLSKYPGTCQLHHAEVLSIRGMLAEAEAEVVEAAKLLSTGAPWAEGEAHRIRGDILLLRGDVEGAEREFRIAYEQGWDPQPGYALLQNASGRPEVALKSLERSLRDPGLYAQQRRSLLLANLVVVACAAGDLDRGRSALAELEAIHPGTLAQRAIVERARGELALADGRRDDALSAFRQSLRYWEEVGSPMQIADVRLRTVEALLDEDDLKAAELDLLAAMSTARRLGLKPLIARCEALQKVLRKK